MDWRAGMGEAALAALDAPIEPPTRSEEWSAEPASRLGSAVEIDRVHGGWPSRVRIAGCTLEGARHYWLSIFKLEREYEPAELEAEVDASGAITVHVAKNLRLFEVLPPQPLAPGASLTVEGQRVPVGDAIFAGTTTCSSIERLVIFNKGYKAEPAPEVDWTILEDGGHGKQPAVCGPIDAAFASDFICVTGSGTPWDPAAEERARESLRHFREAWRERGTGELRVVSDDEELSEAELQGSNLILFGDPGSNGWIARALPALPIAGWTRDGIQLIDGEEEYTHGHSLSMISPSPWAFDRYLVLNAGDSFGEPTPLRPRRADYAVVELAEGAPRLVRAGFMNNEWCLDGAERKVSYKFDEAVMPWPTGEPKL